VEQSGSLSPTNLRGTFELRHVDFSYPNGTPALHDVSLTIAAGQTTALVGLSGAGKSTVLNLLCKFYEPAAGELLQDRAWSYPHPYPTAEQRVGKDISNYVAFWKEVKVS